MEWEEQESLGLLTETVDKYTDRCQKQHLPLRPIPVFAANKGLLQTKDFEWNGQSDPVQIQSENLDSGSSGTARCV